MSLGILVKWTKRLIGLLPLKLILSQEVRPSSLLMLRKLTRTVLMKRRKARFSIDGSALKGKPLKILTLNLIVILSPSKFSG
jgi:hypothetical protein